MVQDFDKSIIFHVTSCICYLSFYPIAGKQQERKANKYIYILYFVSIGPNYHSKLEKHINIYILQNH